MVQVLQDNINMVFIGRLNQPELVSGVSLGTLAAFMMCYSVFYGLNSGLDTLVSQAYGSGDLKKCGVILNRARFVIVVEFMIATLVIIHLEKITLWLGQNPKACAEAQKYIMEMLPAILIGGLIDT